MFNLFKRKSKQSLLRDIDPNKPLNASYASLNKSIPNYDRKTFYMQMAIKMYFLIENVEMCKSEQIYNFGQNMRLSSLYESIRILKDIKNDRRSKRLPADRVMNAVIAKYKNFYAPDWVNPEDKKV